MDVNPNLKKLANETVDVLKEIADKAQISSSQSDSSNSSSHLAVINTFNDTGAVSSMDRISSSVAAANQALQDEPAIARIIYDDGEQRRTLYVARKGSIKLNDDKELASYGSPKGHLASLNVGDEYKVPIDGQLQLVEVIETLTIKPSKVENNWDSSYSVFTSEDEDVSTIAPSLRKLFENEIDLSDTTSLDLLLSDQPDGGVVSGVAHQVRMAMSLRDQPILDKIQSEIFRLPLESQLIILGPPGTGKTTTLIKRLGQKLDIDLLDPSEKAKINKLESGEARHKTSWVMFTPTDLLKHYLKEAFAKEQVPASNDQLKTWDNYSNILGRNTLSILQSGNSSGFILKPDCYLNISARSSLPTVYEDFISFHQVRVADELSSSIEQLSSFEDERLKHICSGLLGIKDRLTENNLIEFYRQLEKYQADITQTIEEIKAGTDKDLRGYLALQFNKNKQFIEELTGVINDWKSAKLQDSENEEFDEDDEDEVITTAQQQAFSDYKKAIRALGKAKFLKRSLPKGSLSTTIIDWLGERLPNQDDLIELGSSTVIMTELRKFKNAEVRYLKGISRSYRLFRKSEDEFRNWFESTPSKPNYIEQCELDILILANLKIARALLKERFVQQKMESSGFSAIQSVASSFKNQILVDEATDFSPIQLACMESLSEPSIGSFFACGDFNQRITELGTQSTEQLNWISPKLKTEKIDVVYRQSELLNQFAKELLMGMKGDIDFVGQLPKNANHKGVSPVIIENTHSTGECVSWLKDRILEVERKVGQQVEGLPTIAILVNHEDEVIPMADALTNELEDHNIRAEACVGGKSLGEANDVRVFDVQHIKGLEFEAVFFVGVDTLANKKPELFDKYLYVGATRAATFFGLTCEGDAPELIADLKASFCSDWR
ncbi:ATP-binding domain-containing protein [Pseudoalteromonas maricaloris]|uniref:ATP-binding domain-containing protein n=1 Tax=Pseudoalteromonas maricaloris TaxID=184924 RepID=UPI000299F864|nr:ATP-binding domain-containing protein [Pseudoalteromonas flavipulchra]